MLYYIRDNSNNLIGFKNNLEIYYYQKNIQEDITGIYDSTMNILATYEYDAWGRILSIKDNTGNDITNNQNHIANINPFRYRSYYYDTETKLYYLNSRYYCPEWGRFINADGVIGANQDLLSANLYSYSSNNSINFTDTTGEGIFSDL